jgi:outer membrane protein OmpA-like peptidoglycan-associated protein/tetratricopeptide (TPR) repeat protein
MYSIRCVLIFLAVAGLSLASYSQDTGKKADAETYLSMADEMRAGSNADNDIRDILVMAATADPTNLRANFDAGYYYLKTLNKDLAVQYFLRVYELDKKYHFDIEYRIGQSYQYGLEFDKATDFFTRYKEKLTANPTYSGKDKIDLEIVERNLYECQNGKEFVASPKNFSIVNIGKEINSDGDDFAPVLNEAEDEIVFTSRRREGNTNENVDTDNKPFEDIFMAKKVGGNWTAAKNAGPPINTPSHDSNLALSADGKMLLIYSTDNAGDIYYCDRQTDNTWSKPKPLPGNLNSMYEDKSATLTKDQKTIYFSSTRPGGFGGIDIYKATVDEKGNWSHPKNLGPKVNTVDDDDAPFIDYDGKTLYFSSRAHKGMGGFDIFKVVADDKGEWSEPENLGYPINTPDNDIFYVTTKSKERAYYSSVREDALGYEDIYVITVPPPPKKDTPPVAGVPAKKKTVPLKYIVRVVDADTKKTMPAKVKLNGVTDNVVVGSNLTSAGMYEFKVLEGKDYKLSVEAGGYMFVNETVTLEGLAEKEKVVMKTVELKRLEIGLISILRNIYFDFNKATFKQESYNELSKLERMLQQNTSMNVEIGGHTDIVGTKNYNKFLSQKRAEAVKDFLTKKGIDSRRITAVGYGSSKPLASNDDEDEGRELNRRVEFKVLSGK